MPSTTTYSSYNFPDIDNPFPVPKTSTPVAMSSSNGGLAPPSTKSRSAAIVESEQIKRKLRDLEVEVDMQKEQISSLEDKLEHDRSQLNKLTRIVRLMGEKQKADAAAAVEAQGIRDAEQSDDSDDEVTEGMSSEERLKVERSVAAANSNVMKSLVRDNIAHLMGIANLDPKLLPPYPPSDDKDQWPHDTSSGRELLRFRWDQDWKHDDNWAGILSVCKHIKAHGGERVPAAATSVHNISAKDLEDRVTIKFKDLVKAKKDAEKGTVIPVIEEQDTEVAPNALAAVPAVSKGKLQSRAKGKCEMRLRKRGNLPASLDARDEKYNALFFPGLMSDDEDEYDVNGERTGKYLTRAPEYRSQEVINVLAAVDAATDPTSNNKYTIRTRGPIVDDPPKTTRKLEGRARRWMVSTVWLATDEHKVFDIPSRIAESGKAWGDEEDPEETEAENKRFREEKDEIVSSRKKRKTEGSSEVTKGKRRKGKARESTVVEHHMMRTRSRGSPVASGSIDPTLE